MPGDCHIHMVLDGVSYQAAIGHHRQQPDEALIRSRLKSYQRRGITYLRDGGDSWGVSLLAAELAPEYGITYRSPAFPICRKRHYGTFIGNAFETMDEYLALLQQVRRQGGHFVKLMLSGIMDFSQLGRVTDTFYGKELICDLVHAAHDAGFAVMAHANGTAAIGAALEAGIDSLEHGAYMDEDTLQQLAESRTVWVPTVLPIAVHRGRGQYPDAVLEPLVQLHLQNIAKAAAMGASVALGTDAGASLVYHRNAVELELQLLRQALGEDTERVLQAGEEKIRMTF